MATRFSRLSESVNDSISDINVTPFVDVLLVLLVIFMITAPLFTNKSIDIQLPKEDLRSPNVQDARKMVISINRNGVYYIRGKRYQVTELLKELSVWVERSADKTVFIKADRRVRYEKITALMVLLKNNGYQSLGLLVEDKI